MILGIHKELVDRILGDNAHTPLPARQAAFDGTGPDDVRVTRLVETVAHRPDELTDGDFEAAAQAGLSDDQLWELIICAAVGQSSRQYENALRALDRVGGVK